MVGYNFGTYQFTGLQYISGVYSLSKNLAKHRPAWFGYSDHTIYAVDGNLSTCMSVSSVAHDTMVVDLGFHVDATLHADIAISGGRLNKKDGLTRYGNSHVKDKTS